MFTRGTIARALACSAALSGCAVDPSGDDAEATADAVLLGRTIWVSPSGDDANNGRSAARPKRTVQAAVDALGAGGDRRGTVRLLPGTYTGTVNVEGYRHLRVVGVGGRDEVTLRPASTLGWNVSTYGESRRTPVRVVRSEDVTFQGVTFDFTAVRGDLVAGVLAWDSTGSFEADAFTNMSAEGYYEFTAYVSAPSFTDANRARVHFIGNEFTRTGRAGVLFHGWTHGVVHRNGFRTEGDFGYGVIVSSQATADIRGNDIAGYATEAATDGSASAGVFIDNAFTAGSPHVDKVVTVRGNHLSGNGYGVSIGNAYPGLSGDVDVAVRLESNFILDSATAGVQLTDEGRSAGSSVTVSARGNLLRGGAGAGYLVYTAGNGEVHLDASGDAITGNDEGVHVYADPGASLHDLSIRASSIAGNASWGVRNLGPSVFDARSNWWGGADGPADAAGTAEVTARNCDATPLPSRRNAVAESGGALGDAVSDNVDYCAWLRRER